VATSVHRLALASVRLPGRYNPPTFSDTRINVYAYLVIAHPAVILIDTGVGSGNRHVDARFEPRRRSLEDELGRFGVVVADVTHVVNSHLHFDHCGNNDLFRRAETFIQEDELAIARDPGAAYTVPAWFDYDGARITPVRGDVEIVPGITLLASPGHTPGHQSVLVGTAAGPTLIAAQAAFTADEYIRGGDGEHQAHEGLADDYVHSIAKLKSVGAERALFSHDSRIATARGVEG